MYFLIFTISTLLFFFGGKSKKYTILFSTISISLLCLLAAFRSNQIGTDTLVYPLPMFNAAVSSKNFQDFLHASWTHSAFKTGRTIDFEIGFVILTYCIAKLFVNRYIYFFLLELLIILPIYLGIKKIIPKSQRWMSMLIFMLLFYNLGLNLVRQSIAISFLFYGICYFISTKKCFPYIICQILCLFIHKSSLLGIFLFLISYIFLKNKNHIKFKFFFIAIVMFIGLLLSQYLKYVLPIFGLDKYVGYISGDLKFLPNQLIAYVPLIIMLFVWVNSNSRNNVLALIFTMILCGIFMLQFSSVNPFGGRIAYYFLIFIVIIVPLYRIKLNLMLKIGNVNINIINVLFVLYGIIYWCFYYGYSNIGETVPYLFY